MSCQSRKSELPAATEQTLDALNSQCPDCNGDIYFGALTLISLHIHLHGGLFMSVRPWLSFRCIHAERVAGNEAFWRG